MTRTTRRQQPYSAGGSSGYFLGAAMTLILAWIESLHQTLHESKTVRDEVQMDVQVSGWSSPS